MQENAFRNIYNLLQDGGDCLATFVGQAVFYDAIRELAKRKKWKTWLKDAEKIISPYHDSSNPEQQLREMLDKIGFSYIEIQYKRLSFEYESSELFQEAIKALTPFKIPADIFDEFLTELFEEMQRIDFEVYKYKKSTSDWIHNFNVFVLYIKK
ncbi:juvenile hormone acid O-methyltransferase-like isoform X2 [Pieris rapae]|nr:juvenile hormone acid O-methyltransferase-like isoform X2 [Pieris rapae]